MSDDKLIISHCRKRCTVEGSGNIFLKRGTRVTAGGCPIRCVLGGSCQLQAVTINQSKVIILASQRVTTDLKRTITCIRNVDHLASLQPVPRGEGEAVSRVIKCGDCLLATVGGVGRWFAQCEHIVFARVARRYRDIKVLNIHNIIGEIRCHGRVVVREHRGDSIIGQADAVGIFDYDKVLSVSV